MTHQTTPLTIIAELTARPGNEQAVYDACHSLITPTLAEEGWINDDMHRSTEDPAVIIFYENWSSRAHWDAHMASPHLTAFSAATQDTVAVWDIFQGENVRA
ncbi:putative quinol monooxygenase [Deinococcus altitudinis]|uniref:putative quinol monooxygenase n=1 Tax=Deinococcus altitudinis TaxID=468914 RepID=UPI00389279D0